MAPCNSYTLPHTITVTADRNGYFTGHVQRTCHHEDAEHPTVPARLPEGSIVAGSRPDPAQLLHYSVKGRQINRLVDRPLEEYLTAIPSANIAWIDYSTRDNVQDIEQIAQTARVHKTPPFPNSPAGSTRHRGLRHRTGHHAPVGDHEGRRYDGSPLLS